MSDIELTKEDAELIESTGRAMQFAGELESFRDEAIDFVEKLVEWHRENTDVFMQFAEIAYEELEDGTITKDKHRQMELLKTQSDIAQEITREYLECAGKFDENAIWFRESIQDAIFLATTKLSK